ncbi:MAG: molecular chaperone TorD family protein, partial [Verrucomicrobiae bacterium]|nr:molecular chaperone TorD family protein [Verrucomicrobiae bacterium]
YIVAIGHAARGSCPVNEIEYGDLKADPLFQPHRLADLAAFYRAFGLEPSPEADERLDHLSVELEFLGVLAAQEAAAETGPPNLTGLAVCRDAERKFLREHLGRWTPAFARRLARVVGEGALGALAWFTLAFIEHECVRFGVKAGSEDLLLRPADQNAALCDGCGLSQTLPGAAAVEPCS